VLDHRVTADGPMQFLVWWDKCAREQATWESEQDLNAGGENTFLAKYVKV